MHFIHVFLCSLYFIFRVRCLRCCSLLWLDVQDCRTLFSYQEGRYQQAVDEAVLGLGSLGAYKGEKNGFVISCSRYRAYRSFFWKIAVLVLAADLPAGLVFLHQSWLSRWFFSCDVASCDGSTPRIFQSRLFYRTWTDEAVNGCCSFSAQHITWGLPCF